MIFVFTHGQVIAQTIDEGISLVGQGKFAEAKSIFERILEKDENNAEAHYRLGSIFLARRFKDRNADEAADHLEKAIELNPTNAQYQFRYGVALGEKTQKAGVLKQVFLAPKVKKAFVRAVELDPHLVQARIGLAEYCLLAPSIVGGDEEEGWKQLDEAIKLDEILGRSVKISFLVRAKKNNEAEKECEMLINSKPNDWRVWKNYGYFSISVERYDDAITFFKKYIKLRPDTADSFQSLAEALLKKGETDQAMVNLNKSLSLDSAFVPALLSLGEAYQAKGQKKEARDSYRRVISTTENMYYKDVAEKKLKEIE